MKGSKSVEVKASILAAEEGIPVMNKSSSHAFGVADIHRTNP
jgi:hypothetical protein